MTIWELSAHLFAPMAARLRPARYHLSATMSDQTMLIHVHAWNTETQKGALRVINGEQALCVECPGDVETMASTLATSMQRDIDRPREVGSGMYRRPAKENA